MKKRRKQYSAGAIIWIIFKYVSLVFFSFVAVIPIISCVITAFKTELGRCSHFMPYGTCCLRRSYFSIIAWVK